MHIWFHTGLGDLGRGFGKVKNCIIKIFLIDNDHEMFQINNTNKCNWSCGFQRKKYIFRLLANVACEQRRPESMAIGQLSGSSYFKIHTVTHYSIREYVDDHTNHLRY